MFEKFVGLVSDLGAHAGISLNKAALSVDTAESLEMLEPVEGFRGAMIRLGGHDDGSYCIPDDLEEIAHCFSPGVGPSSAFEFDLAKRGIPVSLADASVPGPTLTHPNFRFRRSYIASYSDSDRRLLSINDWCALECGGMIEGDLLLQMDIEGNEYEVIHAMSEALLQKFRIIVVEYHHLNQLRHATMCAVMKSAIAKLSKHFVVCHAEPNFSAGTFWFQGKRHPRLLEVTYLRKDRWDFV